MRSIWAGVLLVAIHGLVFGCQPSGPLGRSGLQLTPPASWRPVKATTWLTPGLPLGAWSGPSGSSLVVYRTLPIPGGSPAAVARALANRLENLPGLTVHVQRVENLGNVSVARVEVVAAGTGDALAPTGSGTPVVPDGRTLVRTRQVTVVFVRPEATYHLAWHVPEAHYSQIEPDIRTVLESVHLMSSGASSYHAD
jgi:hypothetical protein